jgi:hypothetical protein
LLPPQSPLALSVLQNPKADLIGCITAILSDSANTIFFTDILVFRPPLDALPVQIQYVAKPLEQITRGIKLKRVIKTDSLY